MDVAGHRNHLTLPQYSFNLGETEEGTCAGALVAADLQMPNNVWLLGDT